MTLIVTGKVKKEEVKILVWDMLNLRQLSKYIKCEVGFILELGYCCIRGNLRIEQIFV